MKKYGAIFLAAILLVTVIGAWGAKSETKSFLFPADDVEILDIKIELGAGEFDIKVDEMDELAKAEVIYNPTIVEVMGEYEKRGKTGYLDFESSYRRHIDMDDNENEWLITLSSKYKTELTMEIGASESEIELGGLPLELLDIDIGAAEARLNFTKPNPSRADEIIINAGAASFMMLNLGNANFRRLTFEGGVGDFELDFSGEYRERSRAEISIGLGAAKIFIPADLPVRIDAEDNFLSSIEFRNVDRSLLEDNYYESESYRTSSYGLALDISVGLGSVEIVFED